MDVTTLVSVETLQPEIRSGVIVLIFIAFDILFGFLQALTNQTFESQIMRKGLFHKLGEILCYLFGVVSNQVLPMIGVAVPFSLANAITIYIVIMEIGSILENLAKISPDMAKYIGVIFRKLRPPDDFPDPAQEEEQDDTTKR